MLVACFRAALTNVDAVPCDDRAETIGLRRNVVWFHEVHRSLNKRDTGGQRSQGRFPRFSSSKVQ